MTENMPETKKDASVSTEVKTWGAFEDMEQRDLVIAKLYQQQGISKFTMAGLAKVGDWCDSLTMEVICPKGKPLELLIFASYKNLQTFVHNEQTKKFDWEKTERYTPELADFEYRSTDPLDGKLRRRGLQYNYFCLPANRIHALPYVLSLTNTKSQAARTMNSFFGNFDAMRPRRPSCAFVIELHETREKKEEQEWLGIQPRIGREATKEEIDICFEWYSKVKKNVVTVAEDADIEASESGTNNAGSEDTLRNGPMF